MSALYIIVSIIAAAILGTLVDWLLLKMLPERPTIPHMIAAFVVVVVLIFLAALSSLLGPNPSGTPSPASTDTLVPSSTRDFLYLVRVQSKVTGEYVQDAEIRLEVSEQSPLHSTTDTYGFATISIDSSHAGQTGLLIVEAVRYETYRRYINLTRGNLPDVIQLDPEP